MSFLLNVCIHKDVIFVVVCLFFMRQSLFIYLSIVKIFAFWHVVEKKKKKVGLVGTGELLWCLGPSLSVVSFCGIPFFLSNTSFASAVLYCILKYFCKNEIH